MDWRWVAAGLLLAVAPAQATRATAPTGMIPGGSYVDSCKEIVFDGATSLLYATCDHKAPEGAFSAKGESVRSSEGFDTSGCVANSIFNDNGMLYCFAANAWGNGHVVPQGSYRASCTRARVINNTLIAECDDSDDQTTSTELNLNDCRWGGDIGNAEGRLACEPAVAASSAEPTLIKPVMVAPAVVKPVMIAPIAPIAPAASADPTAPAEPRKRERKKRNRGERGQ